MSSNPSLEYTNGQATNRVVLGTVPSTTLEDCDTLLDAIVARLRLIGSARDASAEAAAVRERVLECAEALRQLQMTLTQELQPHWQHHGGAADVQTRLEQVLAELARTRIGERRAWHQALHDGLTSLPNRRFFRQRLEQELQGGSNLAVLYLDLDGMKRVNDEHGHCIGDQVLSQVASRLVNAVRGADMVSRQGGDEFAVLLVGLQTTGRDAANLRDLAGQLLRAVAAPLRLGALELSVQASIGIALCPAEGASADELIERADAAMYRAKRQGRGYAFFDRCAAS